MKPLEFCRHGSTDRVHSVLPESGRSGQAESAEKTNTNLALTTKAYMVLRATYRGTKLYTQVSECSGVQIILL